MFSLYFVQKITYGQKVVLPVLAIISLGFSFYYIRGDSHFGDDTNNYNNLCSVRLESVKFLEENNFYNHYIFAPFLYRHAIKRPLTGYLATNMFFKKVLPLDAKLEPCDSCLWVFESNTLPVYYDDIVNGDELKLIHKAEKGELWMGIYKAN